MDIFIARQPIFDRDSNVYGYELLFRDGNSNSFPDISSQVATESVVKVVSSDYLNLIAQEKYAFINFCNESLSTANIECLNSNNVIVEVVETVEPNSANLQTVIDVKEKGYRVALDDFSFHNSWQKFLPHIAMLKVDIRQATVKRINVALSIKERYPDLLLVAEKVETKKEYLRLHELGFDLFQGYFFAKPEVIKSEKVSNKIANLLNIVAILSEENYKTDEIEELFKNDAVLIINLLSFVNSSYFNKRGNITSVKGAISFLGKDELLKFVSVALSRSSASKPTELSNLALIRAKFCEHMALKQPKNQLASATAFLVGLFSLADSILDTPINVVIDRLALPRIMKDAIVTKTNNYGKLLETVQQLEEANWTMAEMSLRELGLTIGDAATCYKESIKWVDSINY
ncbi:EAL and HDOD domain-containing protein [Vibrio sp. NTOU-M3]|uniref:EAL and HDOD domain-containing protein n=1 Tax=Vibrio sp. NTOU-M3 TaxID=3234954 RepID=UPI00349F53B5